MNEDRDDALALLDELDARNATYYVDEEGLHVVTPVHLRLDDELLERLHQHRQAVLAVLEAEAAMKGDQL